MKKPYFIYMLECCNKSYYTGYTTDLERRYQEHLDGSYKCKYTRSFPPIRVAAAWRILGELSEAMKIEYFIKRLTKDEKQSLVEDPKRIKEIYDTADAINIAPVQH
jgi:putative endonuclease